MIFCVSNTVIGHVNNTEIIQFDIFETKFNYFNNFTLIWTKTLIILSTTINNLFKRLLVLFNETKKERKFYIINCVFYKICTLIEIITKTLSNAEGLPPRCTWPSTVILVSCLRFSTTTCLTFSAVMGSPSLSIAPSATMIIFKRWPAARSCIQ